MVGQKSKKRRGRNKKIIEDGKWGNRKLEQIIGKLERKWKKKKAKSKKKEKLKNWGNQEEE